MRQVQERHCRQCSASFLSRGAELCPSCRPKPTGRTCELCGKTFKAITATLCPQCMGGHNMHERSCVCCGVTFHAKYANYCPKCRLKNRETSFFSLTPEREMYLRKHYSSEKGRPAEVAKALRIPPWKIRKWAESLGLQSCKPPNRKPWTKEEEQRLLTLVGNHSYEWIGKVMHRSPNSVAMKCKHMAIQSRGFDGYTLNELVLCFGVSTDTLKSWIRQGWLKGRRRGTNHPSDIWAIQEAAILEFIMNYPMAFDLRRVNQLWFMDLITQGKVVASAIKREKSLDSAMGDEDTEARYGSSVGAGSEGVCKGWAGPEIPGELLDEESE